MQQFYIRLVFSGLNSSLNDGTKSSTSRISVHVLESQPFEAGEALPDSWALHKVGRTEAALADTTSIKFGQSQTCVSFSVVTCLNCPVEQDAVVSFRVCMHPSSAKSSLIDADIFGTASCKVVELFSAGKLRQPVVSMQTSPDTTVGYLSIELLQCPCQELQIQAPPKRAQRASQAARLSQSYLLGSPDDLLQIQEEIVESFEAHLLPELYLGRCFRRIMERLEHWENRYHNSRRHKGYFLHDHEAFKHGYAVLSIGLQAAQLKAIGGTTDKSKQGAGPKQRQSTFGMMKAVASRISAGELPSMRSEAWNAAHLSNSFAQVCLRRRGQDTVVPIGRTNVEYRTQEPRWGSNEHKRNCQHRKPSLKFEHSDRTKLIPDPSGPAATPFNTGDTAAHKGSYGVGPSSHRPPVPCPERRVMQIYISAGTGMAPPDDILVQLYHERFSLQHGVSHHLMGEVLLPFDEATGAEGGGLLGLAAECERPGRLAATPSWRPVYRAGCDGQGEPEDIVGTVLLTVDLIKGADADDDASPDAAVAALFGAAGPPQDEWPAATATAAVTATAAAKSSATDGEGQNDNSDEDDETHDEPPPPIAPPELGKASSGMARNAKEAADHQGYVLVEKQAMGSSGPATEAVQAVKVGREGRKMTARADDRWAGKVEEEPMPLTWLAKHVQSLRESVELLVELQEVCVSARQTRRFKRSADKSQRSMMALATNLHVQYLRVAETPLNTVDFSPVQGDMGGGQMEGQPPDESSVGDSGADGLLFAAAQVERATQDEELEEGKVEEDGAAVKIKSGRGSLGMSAVHTTVSLGAPAAHALGLKGRGALALQTRLIRTDAQLKNLRQRKQSQTNTASMVMAQAFVSASEDARRNSISDGEDTLSDLPSPGATSVGSSMAAEELRLMLEREELQEWFAMRKYLTTSQALMGLVAAFTSKLDLIIQGDVCGTDAGSGRSSGVGPQASRDIKGGDSSFASAAHVWAQYCAIGFLNLWEGLLSTFGKEMAMLGDAIIGIRCLDDFSFSVVPGSASDAPTPTKIDLVGPNENIIQLEIAEEHFTVLLGRLLEAGEEEAGKKAEAEKCMRVKVVSAFFTQGINEQQNLANFVGNDDVQLQTEVNRHSLETMRDYHFAFKQRCKDYIEGHVSSEDKSTAIACDRFAHAQLGSRYTRLLLPTYFAHSSIPFALTRPRTCPPSFSDVYPRFTSAAMYQLEEALTRSLDNYAMKNLDLLARATQAARQMGAARLVFCKSGKDRTAMSVTLENATLVMQALRARGFKPGSGNMWHSSERGDEGGNSEDTKVFGAFSMHAQSVDEGALPSELIPHSLLLVAPLLVLSLISVRGAAFGAAISGAWSATCRCQEEHRQGHVLVQRLPTHDAAHGIHTTSAHCRRRHHVRAESGAKDEPVPSWLGALCPRPLGAISS
jgi:hypothetical protein